MSIVNLPPGNLLKDDADALVNTVNCVGVMGGGLALAFREEFPAMYRQYAKDCRENLVVPGKMHLWPYQTKAPDPLRTRWVVNFPTKRHFREDSRLSDVESGLVELQYQLDVGELSDVQALAIPPLGCGLGGLDWKVVRPLIEEYLGPLRQEIRVYDMWPE